MTESHGLYRLLSWLSPSYPIGAFSYSHGLETAIEAGFIIDVETLTAWLRQVQPGRLALPVVVGAAAAGHGVPLGAALHGYLHAFSANLVSAGVRLVPLGQTDGQRIIAALEPVISGTVQEILGLDEPLDHLASNTFLNDWCSMRHETQYTRLFRS